ncbi:DUF7793 family protein [Anaeromicrobium sediminis]|uniref:DUF7793 domain-containing protein n=1 Tax=Anaeromicrobium sediminis TaxID=1478221 RepID=A0A267MND8_9FIRM|nr:hypothetical protein [Anaeromicrobium sediminis]PAB60438.1 hypothetical protein CCE28_05955 [Anaeromicrobium sediminis]
MLQYETEYAKIEPLNNKILKITLINNPIIDIDEAKHLCDYVRKNVIKSCLFVDLREIKFCTKEAMEYLLTADVHSRFKATAVLAKGTIGLDTFYTNLYFRLKSHSSNIRLFTSEFKGTNWLKEYF